jgi:phosphoribosylformylglycinamidine synthase
MVGLLTDVRRALPTGFLPDCAIVLLGASPMVLGASEYRPDSATFPRFDLASERRLGECLRDLAARRLVHSAQDVADGGLAAAVAECALLGKCGARLQLDLPDIEVALFSEDQGRAVVTCSPSDVDTVLSIAADHEVRATSAGETGGDRLVIDNAIYLSLATLRNAWEEDA